MERTKQPERLKPTQVVTTHLTPLLILAVISLCFVGGYFYLTGLIVPPENPESHTGVGQPLEYLQLQPLTGDEQAVSLADLDGRVVLVNIWGTWCPPCRVELPRITELRQRFAGQGDFRLLAVSYPGSQGREDVESLRMETSRLLERLNLDLPTYYDPHSATLNSLSGTINFSGFPTTILVDRRGVIRAVWIGFRPGVETEIERYIGQLLDEVSSPDTGFG